MTARFRVHPLKAALLFPPVVSIACLLLAFWVPSWMAITYVGIVGGAWVRALFAYADVSPNGIAIKPHYPTFDNGLRKLEWSRLTDAVVLDRWPSMRSVLELRTDKHSVGVPLYALDTPRDFLAAVSSHLPIGSTISTRLDDISRTVP